MRELVKKYKDLAKASKDLVNSVESLTTAVRNQDGIEINSALSLVLRVVGKNYVTLLQDLEDMYSTIAKMNEDVLQVPNKGLCSICEKDPDNLGTCTHENCTLFEWKDHIPDIGTKFIPRCSFPSGLSIKLPGFDNVEPCVYEPRALYTGVTVQVGRCRNCGRITYDIIRTPESHSYSAGASSNFHMSIGSDSDQGKAIDFLLENRFKNIKDDLMEALNRETNSVTRLLDDLFLNGTGGEARGIIPPEDLDPDEDDPRENNDQK